jgi:hypothetical protein
MPGPSRVVPYAGMPVRVMHLGVVEQAVVEDVADEGRTLVVGGEPFTLRRLNGRYVRAAEPWYGTRLLLPRPGGDGSP